MLHHKPLPNHSTCNVICGQTDSNSGMQNFMKKVSVHCEFASDMLSEIKFLHIQENERVRQNLQNISFLL